MKPQVIAAFFMYKISLSGFRHLFCFVKNVSPPLHPVQIIKQKEVRYFLFSQHLADGLRITLEIILPALVAAQFGFLEIGFLMSTGALCVSITDAPGPVEHKRNGMLYANLLIFLMSLITGFVNQNVLILALLIAGSTFLFSMLTIYGTRAAAVGTAALLMVVLRMDEVKQPMDTLVESMYLLAGGLWYMFMALVFFKLRPYRPAQRALGDCIHETARFLRIKTGLYRTSTDLQEEFRKLVEQQVIVNEKQDAVRELLFKNRDITRDPSGTARLLLLTFTEVIDLFEHIMATWYDYSLLREKFGATGLLEDVATLIEEVADDIDDLGLAVASNTLYRKQNPVSVKLELLKTNIDNLPPQNSRFILRRILVNLRMLGERVDNIQKFTRDKQAGKNPQGQYSQFVTHQPIDIRVFKDNLTLGSSVFRHSLRMMIACLLGFVVVKLISYGHHSYWILLTLIIILKPGYGLTKQRNMERLLGTLSGGLIGVVIISFVKDPDILFGFILFFMIGTYTYQRLNYIVMVIFTTPFVLILFKLLGSGSIDIAGERLLDTGIAVVLSFMASYLLFPHWESKHLNNYIVNVLKANVAYLEKLGAMLSGKRRSILEYKLVRKELFVSTANLAAAFRRMLSEPKSKQRHNRELYEFVVLNHVLASNIASLTAIRPGKEIPPASPELLQHVKRSIDVLEESLQHLEVNYQPQPYLIEMNAEVVPEISKQKQLAEQLQFIQKVATEISGLTQTIAQE